MSYPYHHHSTGQPDQHGNSASFYGSQTPYSYQQQREDDLDMNLAYGHHNGYNNADNNVADANSDFTHEVNGNDNNNGFPQDSKENMAHPEEGNVAFASVMDILNQLNENDSCVVSEISNGETPSVPLFSSGVGLPYAPENWPNPGDKWTWRVGRRVKNSGYYNDRFLYLPKSYVHFGTPKQPFASKPSVERYIAETFPGADINAFFASFTWDIRSTEGPTSKAIKAAVVSPTVLPGPSTEGTGTQVNGEEQVNGEAPSSLGRGKRKAAVKAAANMVSPPYNLVDLEDDEGFKSTSSKKGKRKALTGDDLTSHKPRSSGRQKKPRAVPYESLPEEKATPKRRTRQLPEPTTNGAFQVLEEESQVDPVAFDKYLSSLDDMINQPDFGAIIEPTDDSYAQPDFSGHEIMQARIRLSSLLNMEDFSSLLTSKKHIELTSLALRVRKDPSLTAEQLVKLRLVEEISMYSEVYLENKQIAEQAQNFFISLAENKAKVASLKNEYSGLKKQSTQLQTEVDYSLSAVQEIDEEIAKLRSQRDRLTALIKDKNKKKSELSGLQNSVANSIPKVVEEIQMANAKTQEWELKKKNAAKREAEILEKFLCLRGFVL
ncbi:hypothetical protein ACFE04_012015 [Oxalis oulophora]